MLRTAEGRQPWNAVVDLLAADVSRSIKAAPGVGKKLVITLWSYTGVTSAAQLMTLQDTTGTIVGRLPASIAAGTRVDSPPMEVGITLHENELLKIVPAAAGPAGLVVAEGYIVDV